MAPVGRDDQRSVTRRQRELATVASTSSESVYTSSYATDDDDSSDSDEDDEEEEEEEEQLQPLQRLSKALKDKQQRVLDARRHPALEWKAEQQWRIEHDASVAAAELDRQQKQSELAERRAKRERKQKRKAQRAFTKQKEREVQVMLDAYEVQLAKAGMRSKLLNKFSIESRATTKTLAAERNAAILAAQQAAAAAEVREALQRDAAAEEQERAEFKQLIETTETFGRRLGTLPAINTPSPPPVEEQDETSSLLVLRVNKSSTALPVPSSNVPESPAAAKRLFFTVNLKRFKHTAAIRGENIGDSGAKELARSLLTGACPRVKTIYLGWNGIKYPGTAALADCFIRGACGQLQVLDLRFNLVDSRAFQELITAIEKSALPELLDLLLQGNILGDEGARTLAHAMLRGSLRGLRTIDVRQNQIRNDGARAVWNVFTSQTLPRSCPKLQMLDMRRNEVQAALLRSFCPCPSYLQF